MIELLSLIVIIIYQHYHRLYDHRYNTTSHYSIIIIIIIIISLYIHHSMLTGFFQRMEELKRIFIAGKEPYIYLSIYHPTVSLIYFSILLPSILSTVSLFRISTIIIAIIYIIMIIVISIITHHHPSSYSLLSS